MKKVRKVAITFMAILIVISFTGCTLTPEIKEESDDRAKVWCNEGCISIYSPVNSIVFVEVTVEYSGKTITVIEPISVAKDENKTITAKQLKEKLFDENSKIISAEIIKQTNQPADTYLKYVSLTILISAIIGIYLAKYVPKQNNEEYT